MRLKMPLISWNNWRKDEDGAAALEFAFLSIPFFIFIIGIIEVALMFASASIMEGAVNDAARLVRTGQLQTMPGDSEQAFLDEICDHAIIMECARFQYFVTTLESFEEADGELPTLDEEGNLEDVGFTLGGAGDVVMIRVTYLYEMMTPMLGNLFTNYPGRKRLMMSTVVLQTEPYEP